MQHTSIATFACVLALMVSTVHGSVEAGATAPLQSKKMAVVARTLAAHDWALIHISGPTGVEDADWPKTMYGGNPSVRLTFDREGHMFGTVCNFITWRYTLDGNGGMKVKQQFMTLMGCGDAASTRLEALVLGQLAQIRAMSLHASSNRSPLLVLRISDGSRWEFVGKPGDGKK